MHQPIYWSVLTAIALLAGVARLAVGQPLLAARARRIGMPALAGATLCSLALIFHCGSMFFASWANALPGLQGAADAVRRMGTASQLAYWVPAALLVVCLMRVYKPALAVLAVALTGVGISMYDGSPLDVHLRWLAFAIIALTLVGAALVSVRRPHAPRELPADHHGLGVA